MRTLDEVLALLRGTVRVWLAGVPQVLTIFVAAWTLHQVALQSSTVMGSSVPAGLSIVVFTLGVMLYVMGLALVLHQYEPSLANLTALRRASAHRPSPSAPGPALPEAIGQTHPRSQVIAMALGPFLAVYALWGLVDEELRDLFLYNALQNGVFDIDAWSVNLNRWQTYAIIAAVAWAVKSLAGVVARRTEHGVAPVVSVFADGLFVFTSTLALVRIVGNLRDWLTTRVVWGWLTDAWRTFLAGVPDFRLPFELTLPRLLVAGLDWFWGTLVPAVGQHLLLPLMWLALAAVVFGWHEITELGRPLVRGRLSRRSLGPVRQVTAWASIDLREKYLPLFRVLRLALARGPRFIGAYLLVATALAMLIDGVDWLLAALLSGLDLSQVLVLSPAVGLLTALVFVPISLALYAVAFDRAIAPAASLQQWPAPAGASPTVSG